jgi:hypothetical protein
MRLQLRRLSSEDIMKLLAVGFALLIVLVGLAFYKFEKFLPSSTESHKPLSAYTT